MAAFYGIDLGTTYSCIATIDSDDMVTVIPNTLTGQLTTPSVVAFDDDGKLLSDGQQRICLVAIRRTQWLS